VWPALVVVVEPVWQGSVAGGAVLVANALGPLALHRLVEPLDLPVPAWRVGRRDDMGDLFGSEQLPQCFVAPVSPRAVGHQSHRRDSLRLKPGECSPGERGDGVRLLIIEELSVGQPGMIVNDCVKVVVAEPSGPIFGGSPPVTSDAVAGPAEPGIPLDIHVQQVPWAWPLIASCLLSIWSAYPREPMSAQDRVDS